jgi:hypothetical protein
MISHILFWVNSDLAAFTPVDPDTPIVVISFQHEQGGDPMMRLAISKPGSQQPVSADMVMQSDLAVLEVEVIRFPKWLSILDMSDSYRVSSVTFHGPPGDSVSVSTQREIQKDVESLWIFFDRLSSIVPALRASKIVSDPIRFEVGRELEVYSSVSRVILSER